jgi:hypothetical protein
MPPSLPSRHWPTAAIVLVAVAAGTLIGYGRRPESPLPRVAAMTSLSQESFAVCTAPMDSSIEGFFVLDFETGDLTGSVLNQNAGKFGVTYRWNVLKDLGFKPGKVKTPKFLLVPGVANLGGAAGGRLAQSVLYVTDAATGVTVAYGIPWNSQQASAGARQAVLEFVPLDIAKPRGGGEKAQ